ncbi:MAG: xanthine dehydrogenase family protein molybdopterin-binding subunit [Chloroflexi bacterium]|nr:MAG: xanthine dehydrogenase family protein molybdopterin-binding subunit [Chloroflexota bacterium]
MAVSTLIGAKIHRREDPRLVSGRGRYVDDMQPTNVLHAAFIRSPYGHAKISRIDLTEATKAPGVEAIYTARDFEKILQGAMPVTNSFVADKKQPIGWAYIAKDETRYQGEIVAVVLARGRDEAADAASLVQVDYKPMTPVVDIDGAVAKGSPTAHSGIPDNIAWDTTVGGGDVKAAFAEADVVVKQRILQQRLFPIAMEGRALVVEYTPIENKLTMWSSTQVPHWVRLCLTLATGIPESNIRVIAPDVGGGFGSKIHIYPEEYLAAAASKLSGQAVKWVEERSENLTATHHGRAQIFDIEVAAKKDGTLLGYKVTQYVDTGAYVSVFSSFQCSAYAIAEGAYDLKNVEFRTVGVLTNTTPTDAYRGAGRPEATHAIERGIDLVARELGMDPVEIRRKNFTKKFPHTNYLGLIYDTGDYDKALTKALEIANYSELRRRQEDLRKQGKLIGIGLSTWIEVCGFGPGQGHATTFAQIAAETLGIPYDQTEVRTGDTGDTPFGYGTYGSRSLHVGGSAVLMSSRKVVDKAKKLAAHLLEAADEDVVFEGGRFYVKGSPDRAKTMGEIAFAAHRDNLPPGMEHGLEATTYYDPPDLSWPFGAHVCVVEVDPETGAVKLQRYVAVDDCGNVINPMIVEGQVHGGVVQGIGQALFEEVLYDHETGQLKTGTLREYMVPTANEIPEFVTERTVTPSITNPLGAKGIGEAGTIASSIAVINAVCDALTPLGIKHIDMPATSDRVWKLIKEAGK